MSAKKTAAKKSRTKTAKKAAPAKPKIKAVEETAAGLVEVNSAAKSGKTKKAKEPKEKKTSALDAAAQVLAKSKEPLNTKQLIEAMAEQGLWTSPGGKTPHATLFSALMREINAKGKEARFAKTERGRFAINA